MLCVTTDLLDAVAGEPVRREIDLRIDLPLIEHSDERVPRAAIASALCALLFHGLVQRVPEGRDYVEDQVNAGRKVCFDHGAIRTVDGFTGSLPQGEAAFARILEPLGFIRNGVYPLDRLKMTGRVFTHADSPEGIAQFFVSELHVNRFSQPFQAAASRVMSTSIDPLPASAIGFLERLRRDKTLHMKEASQLLGWLLKCFDRHHLEPHLQDYELLLAESAEMAWIATEGNVFNHATDRVRDIRSVAEEQRRVGRSLKKDIEVSKTGRVLQTAFRASAVRRRFRTDDGGVDRYVPGSFYEFIQRERLPSGRLDLSFDSGNATGIFNMTAGGLNAG
jgi:Domain of unknown function (DUF1338)